jgi:ribosomal protein S18 acetylase RimI-like enzyme
MIRLFTVEDYDEVLALWKRTAGVGIRSLDDSREVIARFVKRNPTTNFVAEENGQIIGAVLGGHDGRRGYIYHACVDEAHRQKSIGRQLIEHEIKAMKEEKISKLALVCFEDNEAGNWFWSSLGWTKREDLNYYNISLVDNNV